MQKKHRATSTFLIIGISLLFSLASAYSNCNILLEADFLNHGAKFEAGDIDDLLVDKQMNLHSIPSAFFVIGSPGIDLQGSLIDFSFQIAPVEQSFSILRC